MKMTFQESIKKSSTEFYLLRQRAENEALFDQAVEWMTKNSFVCDLSKGSVKSKEGFVSQFTNYDWAHEYETNPHFIFYDFFRGPLLVKYSRLLRGE
jgi:hypothetical protein